MAWVEVHQSLRDHRKVLTIADELALPEPHVAGHLVFLWLWALDNAPDGSLPASARLIERASGWNGEPGAFMQALIAAGLLEHDGDNLRIHDWDDYAHLTDKKDRAPVRRAFESLSRTLRPIVLSRSGYRCTYCGSDESLEIDHIVPIARRGTNDISNLQALCRPCNRRKGAL